jgi:putative tricarboxylic transport membrane protein
VKPDLRNNKDFLSGLMFAGVGAVGWWMALDYPFGSALRMGPGYFPSVLSVIMFISGLYFMGKGLRSDERVQGTWSLRALSILPLAMAVFGILMEDAGFIPASLALIIVSALAGREFKWVEVTLLAVGLTIVSAAGFIYGLGLPYPLIKGFWG